MGATLPIPPKPMPGPADYRVDDVGFRCWHHQLPFTLLIVKFSYLFAFQVGVTRRRAPKFSMGIYHSPYKLDIIDKGKDDWLEC